MAIQKITGQILATFPEEPPGGGEAEHKLRRVTADRQRCRSVGQGQITQETS